MILSRELRFLAAEESQADCEDPSRRIPFRTGEQTQDWPCSKATDWSYRYESASSCAGIHCQAMSPKRSEIAINNEGLFRVFRLLSMPCNLVCSRTSEYSPAWTCPKLLVRKCAEISKQQKFFETSDDYWSHFHQAYRSFANRKRAKRTLALNFSFVLSNEFLWQRTSR